MNKELREIKRIKKLLKEYEEEEYDIYTDNGANNYLNDDMINSEEEGFMMGYLAS